MIPGGPLYYQWLKENKLYEEPPRLARSLDNEPLEELEERKSIDEPAPQLNAQPRKELDQAIQMQLNSDYEVSVPDDGTEEWNLPDWVIDEFKDGEDNKRVSDSYEFKISAKPIFKTLYKWLFE